MEQKEEFKQLYELIKSGPIFCGCIFRKDKKRLTYSTEVNLVHGSLLKITRNFESDDVIRIIDIDFLNGSHNAPVQKALAHVAAVTIRKHHEDSVTVVNDFAVIKISLGLNSKDYHKWINNPNGIEQVARAIFHDVLEPLEAGQKVPATHKDTFVKYEVSYKNQK